MGYKLADFIKGGIIMKFWFSLITLFLSLIIFTLVLIYLPNIIAISLSLVSILVCAGFLAYFGYDTQWDY